MFSLFRPLLLHWYFIYYFISLIRITAIPVIAYFLIRKNMKVIKRLINIFHGKFVLNILREMDENKELRDKKTQLLEDDGIYKDIKAKINSIYEGGKSFFRTKRGAGLLIDTFKGKGRSKSWNFPLYVVAVFFTIEALFMSSRGLLFLHSEPYYIVQFSNYIYAHNHFSSNVYLELLFKEAL